MGASSISRDIEQEESIFSSDVVKTLNAAVQARDVQKKADEETTSSGRTPPKQVVSIFESAAEDAASRIRKKNKGVKIEYELSFKFKKDSWIASVAATASFEKEKRGGVSYQLEPGDTLWSVAEEHYGSGVYWDVIEKFNKNVVTKGDFIICGAGLKIPLIEVIRYPEVCSATSATTAPREATKITKEVWSPTLEVSFESKHVGEEKFPGGTMFYEFESKGKYRGQVGEVIPLTFNIVKRETELKASAKEFALAYKIDSIDWKEVSISNKITGSMVTMKLALQRDASVKGTAQISMNKMINGVSVEVVGEMALLARFLPDVPDGPKVVPAPNKLIEWLKDNDRTLRNIQIVAGAVAMGAVVVVAGPVAGALVVEYAEATALAGGAMKLIFN